MEPRSFRPNAGPESIIQDEWILYLRAREWVVKVMHGNVYQSGVPDLYAAHKIYRTRWIECKNTEGQHKLENSQITFFTQLSSVDVGVWVLGPVSHDEYMKLFKPANWQTYTQVYKSITRPYRPRKKK